MVYETRGEVRDGSGDPRGIPELDLEVRTARSTLGEVRDGSEDPW